MAKEKKSFFERLTGAVHMDEESEQTRVLMHPGKKTPGANGGDEAWEEPEGQLTVDVYQTPTDIVIQTMVAGVHPDDLDISITRDMVTIKGKRQMAKEIMDDNYFFRELYWGNFSRTILLPQEIEVEEANASQKYGLLTITLPKVDKGRQTKLRVKSE